jgi:hypothetical protein
MTEWQRRMARRRDIWAYVAFVALATLRTTVSCSFVGQFKKSVQGKLKEIDNNGGEKLGLSKIEKASSFSNRLT